MTSRAVVVLPQPVSPTSPERLAGTHREIDAIDGLDGSSAASREDATGDREVLDEATYLEQRLSHVSQPRRRERAQACVAGAQLRPQAGA